MTEVVREISEMYMVDGFHVNRWEGSGICYCQSCKKEFYDYCGLELPTDDEPFDKAWDYYYKWLRIKHLKIWDHLNSVVQTVNPNEYFLPNLYQSKVMTAADISSRIKVMNVDYQSHNLQVPSWDLGRAAKKLRGMVGEDVTVITGITPGYENHYRWKDSVRDIPDLKLWFYEAMANGLGIAWGKFSAVLYDCRWLKPVEELFSWNAKNDHYFSVKHTIADVAVVYPILKTIHPKGENAEIETEDFELGIYFALMEARIPFNMIHSDNINKEYLKQ
jgi:hypothetical protein